MYVICPKYAQHFLTGLLKHLAARRSGYTSSLVYIEGSFNWKPSDRSFSLALWPPNIHLYSGDRMVEQ